MRLPSRSSYSCEKETLATGSPHLTELKDLSRRRERLVDEMTALKNDMKRILSVTFPELETITGIFTKSTLRLLTEFPSAHAIANAGYDAVAAIVTSRSRGRKSSASVKVLHGYCHGIGGCSESGKRYDPETGSLSASCA